MSERRVTRSMSRAIEAKKKARRRTYYIPPSTGRGLDLDAPLPQHRASFTDLLQLLLLCGPAIEWIVYLGLYIYKQPHWDDLLLLGGLTVAAAVGFVLLDLIIIRLSVSKGSMGAGPIPKQFSETLDAWIRTAGITSALLLLLPLVPIPTKYKLVLLGGFGVSIGLPFLILCW